MVEKTRKTAGKAKGKSGGKDEVVLTQTGIRLVFSRMEFGCPNDFVDDVCKILWKCGCNRKFIKAYRTEALAIDLDHMFIATRKVVILE